MIPLRVVDIFHGSKLRSTDVWFPDTDVLVLLIDREGSEIQSNRCTRSCGLIGLHHFTGADLGGKFVGVSKTNWISAYLSLPPEDEIVQTFTHMGNDSHAAEAALKSPLQDYGNIPEMYRPIE